MNQDLINIRNIVNRMLTTARERRIAWLIESATGVLYHLGNIEKGISELREIESQYQDLLEYQDLLDEIDVEDDLRTLEMVERAYTTSDMERADRTELAGAEPVGKPDEADHVILDLPGGEDQK